MKLCENLIELSIAILKVREILEENEKKKIDLT